MKSTSQNDEFLKKRAERQRKIRKRRLKIFFVFLVILSICVAAVLSLTVFFKIENLNAGGSKIYTSKEIIKASGIKTGDNMFVISKQNTELKIRKKLPYVSKITVVRKIPDSFEIKVTDSKEYAAYSVGSEYYIVSEDGWVLKKQSEKPDGIYIVLGADVNCKTGSEVVYKKEKQKQMLDEIRSIITEKKLNVNSIDISDIINVKIEIDGRFTVYLGTVNNLEEKISHVAVMAKNIAPEQHGIINVSMWVQDKPQGTFTPTDD